MSLQLEYDVTRREFGKAYQVVNDRLYQPLWGRALGPWPALLALGALIGAGGSVLIAWQKESFALTGPVFTAMVLFALGSGLMLVLSLLMIWSVTRWAVIDNSLHAGRRTLNMGDHGVTLQTAKARLELSWEAVRTAYWTRAGLLLVADASCFIQVPKRAVPESQLAALKAFVHARVSEFRTDPDAAVDSAALTPSHDPAEAEPPRGSVASAIRGAILERGRQLLENLSSGLRLALLLVPVDSKEVHPSAVQFIALSGLMVGAALLIDYLAVGAFGRIDALQAGRLALLLLAFLGIGAVTAGLAREPALAGKVSAALAGAAFWIAIAIGLVAHFAGQPLPPSGTNAVSAGWQVLIRGWVSAVAAIAVLRLGPKQSWGTAAAGAVAFLVIGIPGLVEPTARLWTADMQKAVNARAGKLNPGREEVLLIQPELLEAKLRELRPHRPGVTDLYFVSAGLFAGQDVFMNEARDFRTRVEERFGLNKRSLSLINNPRTAREVPFANSASLRRTLQHIGRIIDREEDVLFLYLTSHGDCRNGLTVGFWPFQFRSIDAATLKDILDEAGIKWRVIVVSACHSGALVPGLANANTLIMTSASSERFSRGCGQDSKYTDFGDAYFNQGLKGNRSFIEAFHVAKGMIAEREREDGLEPSDPQMSVGTAIRSKLAALDKEAAQLVADTPALTVDEPATAASKLAASWPAGEFLRTYRQSCLQRLSAISPETMYRKDEDYFAGAAPNSYEWDHIETTFDQYVEQYCTPVTEPELRRMYASIWSATLPAKDLEAIAAFAATPAGQALVKRTGDVTEALYDQLGDRSWDGARNTYWWYLRTVEWAKTEVKKKRKSQ